MAVKGYDLDDTPTSGGNRKPKPGELVEIPELVNKWQVFRLAGPVFAYGVHWVTTKKRDGSKTSFPTACLAFDPETGRRDSTKPCPWCSHDGKEIRFTVDYYSNAVSRKKQKSAPAEPDAPTKAEIKSGYKIKDTDTFTPYVALRMPQAVVRSIKGLKDLNVHENAEGESQGMAVSHPKYGCDISIKKDPDQPPASRYTVQKLDHKPLTKAERNSLLWDLSDLQDVPSLEDATREFKDWAKRNGVDVAGSDDDEDDDDDTPKRKKSKRPVDDDEDDTPKKKAKRPVDDDDEEDEPPRKSSKKRVVDEDDEDDEPAPKKRRAPPPDDDDDEDDTPPPKKSAKKKVVDEDDDDEDEPPRRATKKRPVDDDEDDEPAPKKTTKKRVVDEDDEDDEPPRKKTAKRQVEEDDDDEEPAPKKKAAAKKRVVEDDDDDDIPF